MLGQSMSFYQDEFAGRVATKVMQTALAVRDTWITATDILAFITIYFVTMLLVVGNFDLWMLAPFLGWLALYAVCLRYFVPRLGRGRRRTGRRALADDRARHRCVFQHRDRQAVLARESRGGLCAQRDAGIHADGVRPDAARQRVRNHEPRAQHGSRREPRPASRCTCGRRAQVGIGAVAAATAMALRLNGISHWIMWEVSTLFEHVGTVAGRHAHAVARRTP